VTDGDAVWVDEHASLEKADRRQLLTVRTPCRVAELTDEVRLVDRQIVSF
jgi:hypothetical protein